MTPPLKNPTTAGTTTPVRSRWGRCAAESTGTKVACGIAARSASLFSNGATRSSLPHTISTGRGVAPSL
jgi:hypothetical protein